MRRTATALFSTVLAAPACAGEVVVSLQVPRLDVPAYHRPYVAVWLEGPDGAAVANLAVWYDRTKRDGEGTKWLKDLRQWWRRIGREADLPIDGVSGATRPAGEHALHFDAAAPPFAGLKPGAYEVVFEAAREAGEREVLRLPLAWPSVSGPRAETKGSLELGTVSVTIEP